MKTKTKYTPEMLQMAFIQSAIQLINEANNEKQSSNLKTDLSQLEKYGLTTTVNYRKMKEIESYNNTKKNLIETLNQLKTNLPSAIMVPWKEFIQIIKKYNLSVGSISDYNKIIPEQNLCEIMKATEAFKKMPSISGCPIARSIQINKDAITKYVPKLVKYFSKFPICLSASDLINGFELYTGKTLTYDEKNKLFTHFYMAEDDKKSKWLIAAPYEDIPENVTIKVYSKAKEDKKKLVEDPIVFMAHELGAIIVSMWGREADDSVFQKYIL